MALTPKQQRFVAEYLVDLDATKAAIRAGYSPNSAKDSGWENLQRDEVKAALLQAMQARAERTQVSADRVVEELARIGFSDLRNVVGFDKDGVTVKDSEALSLDAAASLSEVSQGDKGLKVKLHDKVKALELLGRHLGMFNDKLIVKGVKVRVVDMTGSAEDGGEDAD